LRARRHADLRTRRRASGPHLFAHRHHRDDPVAVVDYHDVITHHEEQMIAEFRVEPDNHVRNRGEPHACRHHSADAERKVDAVDARHIRPGENLLSDLSALLRIELHGTLSLPLLSLPLLSLPLLSLALLRLALLSLTLLRLARLCSLTLLRRLSLSRGCRAARTSRGWTSLTRCLARLSGLPRLALLLALRLRRLALLLALRLRRLALLLALRLRRLAGGLSGLTALFALTLRTLLRLRRLLSLAGGLRTLRALPLLGLWLLGLATATLLSTWVG
jgi:hypothetical protein